MKFGIYVNKLKDIDGKWHKKLCDTLRSRDIDFVDITEKKNAKELDVLIVLGGDGTILGLTSFAIKHAVPIVGINIGKLGFLTEYEAFEMESAISAIQKRELKRDERRALEIEFNGRKYFALNDAVIQRTYHKKQLGLVVKIEVTIDNTRIDKISGDGVIISTPTGSTAYSLSAGGTILAPGINALSMTPISAHSLHHRPLVYSAESICRLEIMGGSEAGLFVDGKLVSILNLNDTVIIKKAEKSVIFLRKPNANFYDKLISKLNNNN